ncbi:ubiquinone biosynthesis accessory factor UbiJ [Saccharospirillum salsuginis]|uniref:Ubiquinone biosynthesis accessory factor UbiJ n=1 Tax=Saccharospirillum salsuginis TaxID=418750 RepID=A0A918K3L6_9GAMM|nr:SCP2 sterol-binding domain-containing protein [Saccharospirillum salsuginis]GGX47317.1 hypothetical protein GCM10007392_12690 [Saccharospirillum salsuginis]
MSLLALPLQTVINRALEYDPVARRRLTTLVGKTLMLETSEPSLTLALTIDGDEHQARVLVDFSRPDEVHARVSGRASDLFAVLRAQDRTQAMMAHHIDIQGDTRTFFTLQDILSDLDIDWEMALGDRLGDLPAHLLADGLRFFGGMARAQTRSVDRTLRNYLREESGWLVPASLWRHHAEQVHATRLATDRLAARVARLKQRLERRPDEGDTGR